MTCFNVTHLAAGPPFSNNRPWGSAWWRQSILLRIANPVARCPRRAAGRSGRMEGLYLHLSPGKRSWNCAHCALFRLHPRMRRSQWGVLWRNPSSRFPRPPLHWARGRNGRNGRNSARALGPRVYLYVSAAAASPVAGDFDPEEPQRRGEAVFPSAQRLRVGGPLLALRRSLTDDLFQPAVEIARRTCPPALP